MTATAVGPQPPLSQIIPPIILGGAGFSYQTQPDPESLPVRDIIQLAFEHGITAIDTSPFYEPSEQLLGEALSHVDITDHYSRDDYILMTKAGRVYPDTFDYSPDNIRQSVHRSLKRLRTSYLDVVFCHDVDFIGSEDVLGAIGVLLDFVRQGEIRYIGLSGYRIDVLAQMANLVRERFGRPVDVIQTWGQLTLQNHQLELVGLAHFQEAGVSCVLSSSPLAIGLLRSGCVPQGRLGDFHPAPPALRQAAQKAAIHVAAQGQSLAPLSLRYAIWRAHEASDGARGALRISTITGVSTVAEMVENIDTAQQIMKPRYGRMRGGEGRKLAADWILDGAQVRKDQPLFEQVQTILGEWLNYSFLEHAGK